MSLNTNKTKTRMTYTKTIVLRSVAYAMAGCLLFTACNEDEEKETAPQEATVADDNTGMNESDDIIAVSEEDMDKNGANMRVSATSYTNASGATVTFTPQGDNATGSIVLDFGNGIKSPVDGRTRSGKIFISFDGRYRVPNTTQIITLDKYTVNGVKVEGKKTLTNSGNNPYVATSTRIVVEGGKLTYPDGKTIEWNCDRVRNWDSKGTDWVFADDEFTLTGTANGKSKEGVSFTAAINNGKPLLWKVSCLGVSRFVPVSGELSVTPKDMSARVIDYGNGSCDKQVTLSVDDKSWEVTLKN